MNYKNALRKGIDFGIVTARAVGKVIAVGAATAKYLAMGVCVFILVLALVMGVGKGADFEHGTLTEDEMDEIPFDEEA
jgi:hypothetical protein